LSTAPCRWTPPFVVKQKAQQILGSLFHHSWMIA
jgi:hypothetical protein